MTNTIVKLNNYKLYLPIYWLVSLVWKYNVYLGIKLDNSTQAPARGAVSFPFYKQTASHLTKVTNYVL